MSVSSEIGEWRSNAANALRTQVKARFDQMQNPSDCSRAKKLVCDMGKGCGFGCQMHHVMYCFTEAYFQDRVLLLESAGWRYDQSGFESVFKPLSDKCNQYDEASRWNGKKFPIITHFNIKNGHIIGLSSLKIN
jgi:glycoprotein 6-alpha-L-fucosyltransferase